MNVLNQSKMPQFYQSALRREQHEDVTGVDLSSFLAWILVRKFALIYLQNDLKEIILDFDNFCFRC